MNLNFAFQGRKFPQQPELQGQQQKLSSLTDLPPEITYQIFKLVPNELKLTCRHFYVAYNDLYCERLVAEMGSHALYVIAVHALPYLVKYIQSFDYWRSTQRKLVSRYHRLPDYEQDINARKMLSPSDVVHCRFIKDSWKLVYSLMKNRRLFPESVDYEVDEPDSYLYRNMLRINKTYLVKYDKTIKLSPDIYNLSCGIIIQNAMGLGTVKFQVTERSTGKVLLTYYPPSNMDDLVQKDRLIILDIGNFTVPPPKPIEEKQTVIHQNGLTDVMQYEGEDLVMSELATESDKTVEIDILMEECGLYLKSGFTICYIDVNAYPNNIKERSLEGETVPDSRWMFWSIDNQKPTADNVVNILLKNVNKAINEGLEFKKPPSIHGKVGSFAQSIRRRSSIMSRKRRSSSLSSFGMPSDIGMNHLTTTLSSNSHLPQLMSPVLNSVIASEVAIAGPPSIASIELTELAEVPEEHLGQEMEPEVLLYDTENSKAVINMNSDEDDDSDDDFQDLDNVPKDLVSIFSEDRSESLDIEKYNKKFFSIYNEKGELITRTIKFLTVIDKRKYEEAQQEHGEYRKYENEPLKWKLGTLFDL